MSYKENIQKYLIKNQTLKTSRIKNIDSVFLINLDQRPEKLERVLGQLEPFNIDPNRLPAIYGWTLLNAVYEDVGFKLQPGMEWKGSIFLRQSGSMRVNQACYGSAIYYPRMSHGAVGTYISQLSVLQNAYDAHFQTVWVLEDDVTVQTDPHQLSKYIEKLDQLVGPDGWDILYTDDGTHFEPFTPGTVWRPDMPDINFDPFYEYSPAGADFYRIGGRCQAHSFIIRRSGIEKILNFAFQHGIYLPYDVEIAFVPGLRFFNLKANVVSGGTLSNSDTIRRYF
ncbi:MAG: glycosyltransferase 25 family er [Parachlamydiales bacterium]|nr:glycosyltransferase 25 family er [Parachlamydiales bacterium]